MNDQLSPPSSWYDPPEGRDWLCGYCEAGHPDFDEQEPFRTCEDCARDQHEADKAEPNEW